jgi:hypothetical protein
MAAQRKKRQVSSSRGRCFAVWPKVFGDLIYNGLVVIIQLLPVSVELGANALNFLSDIK